MVEHGKAPFLWINSQIKLIQTTSLSLNRSLSVSHFLCLSHLSLSLSLSLSVSLSLLSLSLSPSIPSLCLSLPHIYLHITHRSPFQKQKKYSVKKRNLDISLNNTWSNLPTAHFLSGF